MALTTGDEENGKGDGDADPGYSTGIDVALAATRDLQIAITSKDPTRSQPANLATMRSVMVIRSSQKVRKQKSFKNSINEVSSIKKCAMVAVSQDETPAVTDLVQKLFDDDHHQLS